jgi:hypothetical protein
MADENLRQIPTLEDVVEVGAGIEEENIRIVADNEVDDDPYDDEFKKLFDNATDGPVEDQTENQLETTDGAAQPIETSQQNEVVSDVITDNLWDKPQQQEQLERPAADAQLADTQLADAPPTDDKTDAADSLWISDWQEDVVQSAVSTDAGPDSEPDEIPISDQENTEIIEAAVADEAHDDIADEVNAQRIEPVLAATDEPAEAVTTPAVTIDTGELVNQIVSELMPELEWKLRTKVREVLEQHFPPED